MNTPKPYGPTNNASCKEALIQYHQQVVVRILWFDKLQFP